MTQNTLGKVEMFSVRGTYYYKQNVKGSIKTKWRDILCNFSQSSSSLITNGYPWVHIATNLNF